MPANRPTTIIRDAKAMNAFYSEAKAIGAGSIQNKNNEEKLKLTRALHIGLTSIAEPAGKLDFETQLIAAAVAYPVEPAIAGSAEARRNQRRAQIMAPMLLRSLSPDNLGIGYIRRPTNGPGTAPGDNEIAECGFADEKAFMDHFIQRFALKFIYELQPRTFGYYGPAANTVTLSKKQKNDIETVLSHLSEGHPETIEEFRTFLNNECQKLFVEEGDFTAWVPGTPRPKAADGSSRKELEEMLGFDDDMLQQRIDYMKMWVTEQSDWSGNWQPADVMLNYVDSIDDYNPTLIFDNRGDNPNGAAIANVQLSDLRNSTTGTEEEKKFKKELAAAIDEVSTLPADRNAKIATLIDPDTGEEAKLRQAIWTSRRKAFDGFIRLLPDDAQIAYLEHQGMIAFTAAAPADSIERSIEYLQKLEAEYAAIPTRNAEQQNTLELINGLLVLANAISAENTALKALRGNNDIDTPPTQAEARDPRFFEAATKVRDNRIAAEVALAKTVEAQNARLAEKEFNYGSNKTATEGQKVSKFEYDWETARIARFVQKRNDTTIDTTINQQTANLAAVNASGIFGFGGGSSASVQNKLTNAQKNKSLQTALNAPLAVGATPILAIPYKFAEKEDKSFVAIRVDFKDKEGNKGNILLGKRFMYGVDGQQLTAQQGSVKLQHIVMFDQVGYERAQGAPACVASTLTIAAQRATEGKDIGDGRFTKILNDATDPRSPLNPANFVTADTPLRTPKKPAGTNQQWRYVYEVDQNTPYGVLYWALVDTKTGAVTDQEKVNVYELDSTGKVAKDAQGEPTLTKEGQLLTEAFTQVLTTGLSVYHKCSLEAKDQVTHDSLYKVKTATNDFEVRPILAKEPDFKTIMAQTSSSVSTQSSGTQNTWKKFAEKQGNKPLPSGALVAPPTKKNITQQARDTWRGVKKYLRSSK